MKEKLTVSITRNTQGAYILAAMWQGYRVQRVYMGYTKKEALAMFKQELKEGR